MSQIHSISNGDRQVVSTINDRHTMFNETKVKRISGSPARRTVVGKGKLFFIP